MTKKLFTGKEMQVLSSNPYVKSVSEKGLTYTDEFKRIFIEENEKGKLPRVIFEECGFDIDVIGIQRVVSSGNRWRASYKENGVFGLRDTRKENSGRKLERELTLEEKYARLETERNLLKAENELLKKIKPYGREDGKEITLPPSQKYILIRSVIIKYNLRNMVSHLCKVTGVSRSGYYNYFSVSSQEQRKQKSDQDEIVKEIILKALRFRNRKKGARQIKMTLAGHFQVVYNLKRIRRIMKKYEIVCPIRKANPYKRMLKKTKEHRVVPNRLNREFKQNTPGKTLLTDITYLVYGKNKRAYLSTILDGSTNEILAYHVSEQMTLDLVTTTLHKLKRNKRIRLTEGAYIHSDQGAHYTSPTYQKLVKKLKLGQSMSRKGNCWDNAPQESFFGHLKDEAHIETRESFTELKQEIKKYMTYYNNYRYQWNLKKMTPVEYRNHLLDVA
ncbi:IS3 family transposase [Bacillus pseudomycoides]|uniref:IS3 family transposase n=1 Tax=Bacillus pseudomycoides TaxID=64104 RepID=UPI000BEE1385|nr:IS3 family transposase [Bacillus pseudomycoides]PEF72028.1 IS3 family transposase [Bacillus pseudomycoides]PEJ22445.1 IS3 family transposase [Bacillus pseudomycoides]PEL75021.1 IS3 family transposase [Bacillus pseudomycoides]PHA75818.1 IS3 family transposase [Bacillus pseudomycoides]PHC72998.1 IS3 family transposase [Bacillus pseudomycoides]